MLDEHAILSRRLDKVGPVETVAVGPVQTVVPTGSATSRTSSPTSRRRPCRTDWGRCGKHKIGLAGSTVSNHVNYLHATFAFAQRREDVEVNPVTAAAKPKVKKQDSDFSFLSSAQVDAAIHAVADDYLRGTDRTIILTAAMTGLRQGELIALRWKDVLWADSAMRVRGKRVARH